MSTDELEQIDGVGPAYAETLVEAGYGSVAEVAAADPETIGDQIERANGETLVENAQEEYDGDLKHRPDAVALSPGFSDRQVRHLIRALCEEEVRKTGRQKVEGEERIADAVLQIRDGQPWQFTRSQVSDCYTATSQLEKQYRGNTNVSDLVAVTREMVQYFESVRNDDERWV